MQISTEWRPANDRPAGNCFQVSIGASLPLKKRRARQQSRSARFGFSDTDFSITKNTRIVEGLQFQLRVDAFDIFNHASFGNPNTSLGLTTTAPTAANPNPTVTANSNFGLISSTRFAAGDLGSSRQLQIVGKFIF